MSNEKQRFFNFMSDQHGLTLTDSEMHEIAKEAALYLAGNDFGTQPKQPRPFQAGDKVKWVRENYTLYGTIRNVPSRVYPGYEYVIAHINGQRETFWADGRKNSYDPEPSLFHID